VNNEQFLEARKLHQVFALASIMALFAIVLLFILP
jgi:hypothetical protein